MAAILVVDDDDLNRELFRRALEARGHLCNEAGDGKSARVKLRSPFDVVLLDINLPGESGLDLLRHIHRAQPTAAVIMITGADDPRLAAAAADAGAFGYMVKPVGASELAINVSNALHRRTLEAENRAIMAGLEAAVAARTGELQQVLADLQASRGEIAASRAEVILRVARVVESRDEATGRHILRMSQTCSQIASQLGFDGSRQELTRLASQLHDVGKVSVPDAILNKPGALSAEEFEVMKVHAHAGYLMLSDSPSDLVQLGAQIAWTHHERWDGSGYPRGLSGDDIPVEGQIAAVADVFDALTTDRIYRVAISPTQALSQMVEQRGRHFSPTVLDAFLVLHGEFGPHPLKSTSRRTVE